VGRGDFCEVAVCAAVDVGYGDDMGALSEGEEDCSGSGGAGSKGESILGMLEGSNGVLEVVSLILLAMTSFSFRGQWRTCSGWSFWCTRIRLRVCQRLSGRMWWKVRAG